MARRKLMLSAGVSALALIGGLVWGVWFHGGDELGDECGHTLAVEEARAFFGGADLEARGKVADWTGHRIQECIIWARGSSAPRLKFQLRPRTAYRISAAAAEQYAVPIGYGWNGSFHTRGSSATEGAVLFDCESKAGNGLLVLASATGDPDELSPRQLLQVARLTTETARRANHRYRCEGKLGDRPRTAHKATLTERPIAQARGTCARVLSTAEAARLKVTVARELPAGGALTEACTLQRGSLALFHLTAYYGPSADHRIDLHNRYGPTPDDATTRRLTCPTPIGPAYYSLYRVRERGGDGRLRAHGTADPASLNGILDGLIKASAPRHGCQP